jgi:SAM-dependent methyltransferase
MRVLDAGCGPGFYVAEFLDRGAAEVVGFDASPTMAELARQRVGSRARVECHDLARPIDWLADGSFDLAVMALVIHHLDDRVGALRELNRVLAPDGALVVSTHHPTNDWLRKGGSYFTVERLEEVWKGSWHVRFWRMPLSVVCDEFRAAGFLIERLVEPQPVLEAAGSHSADPTFGELQTTPGFIAFRLVKG